MDCIACNAPIPEDARFCTACGAPQAVACPACGHPSLPGARFCAQCGAPLAAPPPEKPGPTAEAERRQVTVLFCDLAGSTALSAALDPEDMREVLRAYQGACAEVIARFGGFLAKYMGDGVYAYFGWPRAHEDDAERAIHAGLAIVEAVRALGRDQAVRIGIATGTVVVGDLIGEGSAEEAAITGETPNLAARLQAIAAPDAVVIAEATHALAGRLFDCEGLGARPLKGIGEAVGAWRVIRPRRADSRFEVLRAGGLTELVGRDDELDALLRRWRRAKAGEGQVVLVSGEPGIGKSRLARALQERIAEDPHVAVPLQCSPFHTNSALHPFIDQLERALGFAAGEAPAARLDKLEAWIALAGEAAPEVAPLLAALLSIPPDGRYPALEITPQRRKELTLQYLTDRLSALSAERPMLFLVEDAHWIDPTSLELLDRMVDRVPEAAALMLITYRPEFAAPWTGRPRVTPLYLGRLDRGDCARMVQNVIGRASLSEELRDRIVAQTDGVPLFVEELTKSVLESARGPMREAVEVKVPATLMDSLEARLDALGPAKEVAQIGAVIGREFDHEFLAVVAPPEIDLNDALDRLVRSELVFRRGQPPDATYAFKHAMVQDTAYISLLRSRRAELHERIARALEQQSFRDGPQQPEVLAHHFTEAGLKEMGAKYWLAAGQTAFDRAAIREAQTHFERGLEALAELPDAAPRLGLAIELNVALAAAVRTSQGPGFTEDIYQRTYELCQQADDSHQTFAVLTGLCVAHFSRGHLGRALGEAEELMALAGGDVGRLVIAHTILGEILFWGGNFTRALPHLEKGEALYNPEMHSGLSATFARDPGVMCKLNNSIVQLFMGFPDRALSKIDDAVAHASFVKHPHAVWASRWTRAWQFFELGHAESSLEEADTILAFARELGLRPFMAMSNSLRNLALSRSAGGERALSSIEDEISAIVASGYLNFEPWFKVLLAGEYLRLDRADRALELAEHVLEWSSEPERRLFTSAALFTKADALLQANATHEMAENCYLEAVSVAREQGARMFELRAATRLARLWNSQGRAAEARDLLAPVYGWFTEGFETADLKEAKALLDALQAG